MPVRLANVYETIMYEYAKLIADQAVEDRKTLAPAERITKDYWSFVALTFKKLKDERISPSSVLRENKKLLENGGSCAYCGTVGSLQWEHIVPKSRGGPDTIDNMVQSCPKCNREKAAKNPIEWYDSKEIHRKHIPRIVMGKLLKVVLEEHRRRDTLKAVEFPIGKGLHLYNVCLVFDIEIKDPKRQNVDA